MEDNMTATQVTRTRNVFTYDELSDKAKSKAMDNYRQMLHETLPTEIVTEDLR